MEEDLEQSVGEMELGRKKTNFVGYVILNVSRMRKRNEIHGMLHASVVHRNDTEEQYIFVYDDHPENRRLVHETARNFASRDDLSFTLADCVILAERMPSDPFCVDNIE